VEGALLSLGDAHAAQGDGEIGGTALECPLDEFEIRVRLHKRPRMVAPLARTRSSWLTFGFGDTFEAAACAAAGAMLDLISDRTGASRKAAIALASVAVHVRLSQLVNGVVGAHAVAPRTLLVAAGQ
jgi:acetamidase/formamidase